MMMLTVHKIEDATAFTTHLRATLAAEMAEMFGVGNARVIHGLTSKGHDCNYVAILDQDGDRIGYLKKD